MWLGDAGVALIEKRWKRTSRGEEEGGMEERGAGEGGEEGLEGVMKELDFRKLRSRLEDDMLLWSGESWALTWLGLCNEGGGEDGGRGKCGLEFGLD